MAGTFGCPPLSGGGGCGLAGTADSRPAIFCVASLFLAFEDLWFSMADSDIFLSQSCLAACLAMLFAFPSHFLEILTTVRGL